LRKDPKNAHLIIRTEEEILIEFSKLELISNEIEIGWDRYERGMYAIFTKEDPLDK